MHKPASVLDNDLHKLPLEFDIQTVHLISTTPYNQQKKKRTCKREDLLSG